jgi:hypothetical protein
MHTEAEERDGVVRRRAGGAIPEERLVAVERHLQCVGSQSCASKGPSSVRNWAAHHAGRASA